MCFLMIPIISNYILRQKVRNFKEQQIRSWCKQSFHMRFNFLSLGFDKLFLRCIFIECWSSKRKTYEENPSRETRVTWCLTIECLLKKFIVEQNKYPSLDWLLKEVIKHVNVKFCILFLYVCQCNIFDLMIMDAPLEIKRPGRIHKGNENIMSSKVWGYGANANTIKTYRWI